MQFFCRTPTRAPVRSWGFEMGRPVARALLACDPRTGVARSSLGGPIFPSCRTPGRVRDRAAVAQNSNSTPSPSRFRLTRGPLKRKTQLASPSMSCVRYWNPAFRANCNPPGSRRPRSVEREGWTGARSFEIARSSGPLAASIVWPAVRGSAAPEDASHMRQADKQRARRVVAWRIEGPTAPRLRRGAWDKWEGLCPTVRDTMDVVALRTLSLA